MVDIAEEPPVEKKKSGLVMTIVPVVVVTVIAAGAGWFLGGMLAPTVNAPKPPVAEKKAEGEKKEGEGLPAISTEENGVVQLEAITTNLAFPADRWIRLEVALLFKDKPDVKIAETINQDIARYLRTVTLQQIEGPRGFQYLKEDLEERADLLSEGKVEKIMFRTFVIE
ncbi:flagellar basal body-associated FliL family protein [Rhizobium sp. TRM95796]|uniref:flagellar basal body-associated FliL family protein n=1 Tax=Rhizobium sp. TRM95796 TaxID=2979862 RepID=UPI0021E84622|nr:flagellar basal body-associated FliL family protein [Rhizobium sp. TRM95796]MCV3766244.1 flagellar basal body-associated FliL family protein [Rhizobium sp. TRM95796]